MRQVTNFKDGVTIIITERGYSIIYVDGKREDFNKYGEKIYRERAPKFWKLRDTVKIGDYIDYSSDVTSFVVSRSDSGFEKAQRYNPSKLKSWRVFRAEDDVLEIISSDVFLPKLVLKGKEGYVSLVATLNKICQSCVNPKYAISGRSIGSTAESRFNVSLPMTWNFSSKQWRRYPYYDEKFASDVEQLKKYGLELSDNISVWLASRLLLANNNRVFFGAWCLDGQAVIGGNRENYLFGISPDTSEAVSNEKYVRPIVTLKREVMITGGSGTKDNPYKITI